MNNLVNDDYGFGLDNGKKYLNGIQSIGDEMARLVFFNNNKDKIDENNVLFTYEDFFKKNGLNYNGSKKRSFNNLSKFNNSKIISTTDNSNKKLSNENLKIRPIKKVSFNKNNQIFPIKKVSTGTKSKFSNELNQNINNQFNEQNLEEEKNINKSNIKENDNKINNNRINDINNVENIIKHTETNPKKTQYLKFLNKKNNSNANNNENINVKINNNINNINSLSSNNSSYKNSIKNSKNNTKRNSDNTNKNISINDKTNSDDYLDNIDIEILPNISEDSGETSDKLNHSPKYFTKIKGKKERDHIYYVQMNNLRKKENRINKKRAIIIEEKLRHLQSCPNININTYDILSRNKKKYIPYIPIYQRAAQIHSRHLTQNILYEFQKKMEKENNENKVLEEMQKKRPIKSFNMKDWDIFIQNQQQWKEEVNIKRKEAEYIKYELPRKSRNRKIINNLIKKNVSMDNVFSRLYNDFEDKRERQEILNNKYMPSFKPKQSNNKYIKYINKKKCSRNNKELFVTNFNKNNYFLDSQISIDKDCINPFNDKNAHSRNKCKYCYLKNKYNNKNKSKTINNNTIYLNRSTIDNTIGHYSLIPFDNILPSESSILSKKDDFYKDKFSKKENKKNYKNIIRLNKFIKPNKNIQNLEEEKEIDVENIFFQNIFEITKNIIFNNYKNNNNNKKNNKIFNRTISITGNRYKSFFDFDNIEEI